MSGFLNCSKQIGFQLDEAFLLFKRFFVKYHSYRSLPIYLPFLKLYIICFILLKINELKLPIICNLFEELCIIKETLDKFHFFVPILIWSKTLFCLYLYTNVKCRLFYQNTLWSFVVHCSLVWLFLSTILFIYILSVPW